MDVVAAVSAPRRFLSVFGSLTTCPPASYTSSRTATAGIGTATTSLRVAVVMSAVQVKPGRTSGIGLVEHHDLTLKLVACVAVAPVAAWIGLLPISADVSA